MKLNLYSISDKYIKYLRQFDDKIYDNKEEIINQAFETLKWDDEKIENKKTKANQIIVKCPTCNNEFKLNWNVPVNEKTFYCKCPNCNAEIKSENPNYKG